LVEPEVVATSPYRIKSPVPVCCGFSSRKVVLAAGFAPALATFYASDDNWSLPPVLPRRDFLTKEAGGCRKEAKWSQSRVLPSAQLAYETGSSAGSIAKWIPYLVLHHAGLFTEQAHR
jgi:hypothetical protein